MCDYELGVLLQGKKVDWEGLPKISGANSSQQHYDLETLYKIPLRRVCVCVSQNPNSDLGRLVY
jgi:hypothetical protein